MGEYYTPEQVRPLYEELIPTYQAAFASEPWSEVSKCADRQARCASGLSSVAVGSLCTVCELSPSRAAYEKNELIERFDTLGQSRPTAWYIEQNQAGLTMAAVAWRARPSEIAREKYSDVPAMGVWIAEKLDDEPVMWLDEVFANRERKPRGNLKNFGQFVTGLCTTLECAMVAYRTVEPRMTITAERIFNENASVLRREIQVPDRRDFVIIKNVGG